MLSKREVCTLLLTSPHFLNPPAPGHHCARASENFWGVLWICLLHSSSSFLWQNSYPCVLSLDPATHQAGCWHPPFYFPRGRADSQACGVPVDWRFGWPSVRAHNRLPELIFAAIGGAHRAPARYKREGIYVYLWLIHVHVWQKTTKFDTAISLNKRTGENKCLWECGEKGTFVHC